MTKLKQNESPVQRTQTPLAARCRRLIAVTACVASAATVFGADVFKADNTDDLSLPSSWVNGLVTPGASDTAVWDATVTGPNTTLVAVSTNWGGLRIASPAGPVTINATSTNATAGATLTLGASGLDLSAASQDLTFGAPVGLLGSTAQSWTVGAARIVTLNGALTRNARATLNVDTSAGGTLTVASGTASSPLNYTTLNKTDIGGLDGAGNFAGLVTSGIVPVTQNPAGTTASAVSLSGTFAVIDVVNSNPGTVPSAFRLSNTTTVTSGIRFSIPNANNVDWVIDANTRNLNFGNAVLLVTPDAGAHNVIEQDSGTGFRLGTGTEMIVAQHNTSGDVVINGHITQPSGTGANVTKTGAGRLILNNTGNGFGGTLTVEQGTALVNGAIVAASVVNPGATLGGSGTVQGVTISSGATLAAGNNVGAGTLTVNGPLLLNGGTTALNFYGPAVPTTNTAPLLVVSNTFVVNGSVNVSILSGNVAVGQYPLLRWTNAIPAPIFSALTLAAIAPHTVAFLSNNIANSTVDLVVATNNQPLRWATGTGTWNISGAANWKDQSGATTTYQELAGVGDRVVFEDSQSGASPITVSLDSTVVPGSMTVSNNTKAYTISGSGVMGGLGSLTKQGSGSLTLSTANAFSGGINLNGGLVSFSTLANLGAGAINFGGGTLQFASGNNDDISARTVTLGAGGGTIDVGANAPVFANPIGNGGVGSLTKAGSGTLTLSGTNRYSGNTTISGGTLALASGAFISNSPAILINGGAVLDVAQNGSITLSSPVSQVLAGTGSVNGGVNLPASTAISPATNGVIGTLAIAGDVAFNGGTYACDVSASARDLIDINGSITVASGFLQLNVSGPLANGAYKLIQYSGALGGAAGNLTIVGFSQPGKAATLSDATPNEIDLIISDTASDNIAWAGTGTDWDLVGTLDWLNGATPWAYTNGDTVTFDESGAGQSFVNLKAALSPSSVTVNNTTTTYTFADGTGTGAGKISNGASLTKSGAGTLVVDTVNDYTGPTVINGGTLQVGDGATTGTLGTGNIANNAALVFAQIDNRTVAGQISGTGSLTQQGSAVLTLAQNNTYSGPTVISSGTLQVGTGGAVGSLGTNDVTDNGTLSFNRTGTVSLDNTVSGAGALSINGGGTFTLTRSNFYTGGTSINAGKVILGNPAAFAAAGNLTIQAAGTNDLNGHDLVVTRMNSTINAGGRLVNNAGTATNVVTIDYDGTGNADNSIQIIDNEGAGGRIAVVKLGAGSQIMRGPSTYTGGTIVSNGTLNVRGTTGLGAGLVTLRGGNLSFSGLTFANPIQADTNATIDSPGNGTVTLSGTITTASNLTFVIDNNETWTMGGGANQLAGVTGTIFITDGSPAGGFFRWGNGNNGSASATFDMTGFTGTMNSQGANGPFQLGALIGDSTSFVGGVAGTTFVIGGKNLSTTYGGTLNSINNNITKVGAGTFTLSGPDGFTGTTTVSNGVLALSGSATLDNNSAIAVRSGALLDVADIGGVLNLGNVAAQTLSGSGTIRGSVTATGTAVGTINPGDGIGTLTITNALTLAGNSIVLMELNTTNGPATNDMIAAQSFAINGATLTVTNLGPDLVTDSKFKLFSSALADPNFAVVNLPISNALNTVEYVWTNKLTVDGSIELLSGASPIAMNPTNITFAVSGGNLTLSWPADHTGWRLQVQTNALSVGLQQTNWVDVVNSTTTNQVVVPVSPLNGAVFYRLLAP